MVRFTYDIPKNKMKIEADNDDIQKNTRDVIIAITVCSTILMGIWMGLEYRKYLTTN